MSISPERRAEIRSAIETTAKGPWRADCWTASYSPTESFRHRWINIPNAEGVYDSVLATLYECGTDDDARFIAGARQWLPECLDELDRLTLLHAGTVEEVRLLLDNIESMQQEIFALRDQLKEWEKYTGFLYAHGFFRDANTQTVDVKLTTTEDPPHV